MKKILILFIAISFSLEGQNISFNFGVNLENINSTDPASPFQKSNVWSDFNDFEGEKCLISPGVTIGINHEINLSDKIKINNEINFTERSSKKIKNKSSVKVTYDYLDLSPTLSYDLNKISINMGPSINYLVRGRITSREHSKILENRYHEKSDNFYFKYDDFYFGINASLKYKLNKNISFKLKLNKFSNKSRNNEINHNSISLNCYYSIN